MQNPMQFPKKGARRLLGAWLACLLALALLGAAALAEPSPSLNESPSAQAAPSPSLNEAADAPAPSALWVTGSRTPTRRS